MKKLIGACCVAAAMTGCSAAPTTAAGSQSPTAAGAAASTGSSEATSTAPSASETTAATTSTSSSSAPAPTSSVDPMSLQLDDRVVVSLLGKRVRVAVTGCTAFPYAPSVTGKEQKATHGEFRTITVTYEAQDDAVDVNALSWNIVDPKGKLHDYIDAAFNQRKDQLDLAQLYTGEKAKGTVVFDVPRQSTTVALVDGEGPIAEWDCFV